MKKKGFTSAVSNAGRRAFNDFTWGIYRDLLVVLFLSLPVFPEIGGILIDPFTVDMVQGAILPGWCLKLNSQVPYYFSISWISASILLSILLPHFW